MESKKATSGRNRKRKQAVGEDENRSKPATPKLVFGAKIPEARLRRIIRCYAEGRTPAQASELCGVSHVTAYKTYTQIRARLLHVRLYLDPDEWLSFTMADEEEGPYFDWQAFHKRLAEAMGKHRGIREWNRPAYAAEEIFKLDRGARYTAAQLYRLIIFAIKETGPLNRPPRPVPPGFFHRELARLMFSELRKTLRKSPPALRKAFAPEIDAAERDIENTTRSEDDALH